MTDLQIEHIRDFYHHGKQLIAESDTRVLGFLLSALQFAGGWYLFLPYARFVPPFHKLFEAIPPGVWAVYFIISGMAGGIAAMSPDTPTYLKMRFRVAVWMLFNWSFLTMTTIITVAYLMQRPETPTFYGMAIAFYPCLMFASWWKSKRLKVAIAGEIADAVDEAQHIEALKARTRSNMNTVNTTGDLCA